MENVKGTQSRYISILPLIPEGKNNAISMTELSRRMDLDERTVRKIIERARLDGAVIAADGCGYYTPANVDELRRYYKRQRRRAMTNLASLKSAGRMLKALEGEEGRRRSWLIVKQGTPFIHQSLNDA